MDRLNDSDFIMDRPDDLTTQLKIQEEIIHNILGTKEVTQRIKRLKLSKDINSPDALKKARALNRVIAQVNLAQIPAAQDLNQVMESTFRLISEQIARNFVQNRIEEKVQEALIDRQDEYIEEMRMNVIRKEKGPENSKTRKKYQDLVDLDQIHLSRNILNQLRPQEFNEIIGQERAIRSLISKIASPYPQHIILYGPPGVGKTTAARIALEEAKKLKFTPYGEKARFVEVDGTTLRWDPREIANPLLGSVHDPIYQGSKRDLADTGIPEPKTGLVTDAHGGILFIDEIGELDTILQNKLLKVLEDKRVEFSSSYYDPDDENVPQYIRYLFDKGAPADFTLIGATTREPQDISPALKSRCTAVFFEPLTPDHIHQIVTDAARKLKASLEPGVAELIARHTIEGRKAINILSDAYSLAVYRKTSLKGITISLEQVKEAIGTSRITAYEMLDNVSGWEIGHAYGLAVSGFIGSTVEIEAMAYEAREKGKGTIRFNETAGSMAKDSVFNAASVIRKVTGRAMMDYDIHVNVVGGANIDGPSAGAAITLALLSAIENRPVRQDTAITGEISLGGRLKPVGGIHEKIYGAIRKGIQRVIIPSDNAKEVPSGLTGITVCPCASIEEVRDLMYNKE
ncbi:Lon family ATP-dependent protease [Proteiniclasticum sp. QWL-01]|uniref:Lon family ATP-dependent protease n=1 Tax=Proteiniclasticum sp. QWL-01 TaxID=3036945 RepID=UPI0024109A03|nr:Lon family ATP-dependent protease [Proteiniclasticum sp. QWL-01]WFF72944.1 Lon family ATP-dependent protease [Proteiniclasticum sp. QWL-01]